MTGLCGFEIQKVDDTVISDIIKSKRKVNDDYLPLGLFYAEVQTDNGVEFVACDNSNGDAWTELFDNEETAISWLKGEFEMSDLEEEE